MIACQILILIFKHQYLSFVCNSTFCLCLYVKSICLDPCSIGPRWFLPLERGDDDMGISLKWDRITGAMTKYSIFNVLTLDTKFIRNSCEIWYFHDFLRKFWLTSEINSILNKIMKNMFIILSLVLDYVLSKS